MVYLHSLSVFTAVVEEGSFSAAAKKLKLTQPTISFHIDNLEKSFGCLLFIRTPKGVKLTIYGQELYLSTHKIHKIFEDTRQQIQTLVAGNAGEIIIGASTIPGEYILPHVLSEFLQYHPGVKVSLETNNSQTILAGYNNSQFPIAIIGIKPEDNLPHLPLWQDELVLIAHPDWADSFIPTQLSSLLEMPLILRKAPSGTRKTVLQALEQNGLDIEKLNIVFDVTGNEALKCAVLNKVGVGFISRWAVQSELAANRLVSIELPQIKIVRTFYGLYNTALMPTAVQLFWDYLAKIEYRTDEIFTNS